MSEPVISGAQAYADKLEFDDYLSGRIGLDTSVKPFCYIAEDGAVEFNFHAGQSRVMNSPARFVIALASRQSGKSEVGPPWLFDEIRARGPGWYMVVAPSFPLLEDSALPKLTSLFENHLKLGKVSSKPLSFTFSKEGADYIFQGTKYEKMKHRPDTIIRFGHGASAASLEAKTSLACWIDEAGQRSMKAESFEAIEGRHTTTRGRILMTTTPYDFNWLYTRFYLPWQQGQGKKMGIDVINWCSTMNPAFPVAEYERLRASMPAWKFDMFYNGIFTRPAGLIFDNFNEVRHTCTPFKIPDSWARFLGADFGGSNTCFCLFAQDPDTGTLYLYHSYLGGNLDPDEHLRIINNPSQWSSDNSFFDRAAGGAASENVWRKLYRSAGLYIEDPTVKGQGSIEARIDITYSYLSRGAIRIFSDQSDVITQYNTYSREIDQETGNPIPGTIRDQNAFHYVDAVGYLLAELGTTSFSHEMRAGDNAISGNVTTIDDYTEAGRRLSAQVVPEQGRILTAGDGFAGGHAGVLNSIRSLPALPAPTTLLGIGEL